MGWDGFDLFLSLDFFRHSFLSLFLKVSNKSNSCFLCLSSSPSPSHSVNTTIPPPHTRFIKRDKIVDKDCHAVFCGTGAKADSPSKKNQMEDIIV